MSIMNFQFSGQRGSCETVNTREVDYKTRSTDMWLRVIWCLSSEKIERNISDDGENVVSVTVLRL
jgi:hypothetical protein